MVKLPKSKVTKLQKRLNKNPAFTYAPIARPAAIAEFAAGPDRSQRARLRTESVMVSSQERMKGIQESTDFYVAQMDEATAKEIDHRGAMIIRFCDPGEGDLAYTNAGAVHRINMTLYDFEQASREILTQEAKQLIDFIQANGDAGTLHIHCKYGEQRSRGFVRELAYQAHREDRETKFYFFPCKDRALMLHDAPGSGSRESGRLAGMMVRLADSHVNKDPVSEETL